MTVSTKYFYVEDAPGQTYDNLTNLLEEILISLAGTGNGILPFKETQLIDIASGNSAITDELYGFLTENIDPNTLGRPHAYMTYIFYDENMRIVPGASKIIQVQDPNELGTLADLDIEAPVSGYLHTYVSNGSSHKVNFDNFMITYMRGKTRQINDYYPYDLSITGINGHSNEYAYKYQGKEYQAGEFNGPYGVELYDFDARFYDPAAARWFVPDPAEQFHNPYLAMGNNPVMYVDPDGEFVWVAIGIGAAIGAYVGGSTANGGEMNPGQWNWQSGDTWAGMGIGAVIGGAGGYGFAIAAPAMAGTGLAGAFGASGTVAAYTVAGGVSMGVAGYGAGFAGGMLHSNGDWGYGHQGGMFGMQVGSSIGSVLGGAYGMYMGFKPTMPEASKPLYNKPINATPPTDNLMASTGDGFYGMQSNDLYNEVISNPQFINLPEGAGAFVDC